MRIASRQLEETLAELNPEKLEMSASTNALAHLVSTSEGLPSPSILPFYTLYLLLAQTLKGPTSSAA